MGEATSGPPWAVSWGRYARLGGPSTLSGATRSCWTGSQPPDPRGLNTASDQVCVDFIANQTGTRLGGLREPARDRDVKAVRRSVVLMADALAGRAVVVGKSVIPAKDGCPARFCPLRDDYVASCRERGNAEATVATKDKVVSRFLGYLDDMGVDDLSVLGVQDVSGFLLGTAGSAARPSRP